MTRTTLFIASIIFCLCVPLQTGTASVERSLSFYHTHTGEALDVTYYEHGSYVPEALERLNHFLADWRNGEQHAIDPGVLDILWEIQQTTGVTGTYEVISAYRSEETNRKLRGRSKGVAKHSQHLLGKAIDVRLRGLDTRVLRDTALGLELGGVGYYEQSDFVHVDTGRVRRW